MIEKTIHLFTDKEEEFINLLVRIGTKQTIAKTLVLFARLKKATSYDIEHGADLRQPEVSVAVKYLEGKGWIENRESVTPTKGRPIKIWTLKVPVKKILDTIRMEKEDELNSRLEMIRKVRSFA
ncbi:ArsR family transcriptional regulator [Methanoregula sp.]|jgi:predicted transcriptional regulator|uniref:ArsR family transcriptional regulator n=1 Tax=Methanoregula sp. TaxID=2052170 RepID=UPI002616BAA9|nr:ArsR family transcriptional regulator [Methanoregula sp.]MDD5142654.1 ArsR family transcriptional regulator [Methanoregula sp.]